jgi:hypothetical protein
VAMVVKVLVTSVQPVSPMRAQLAPPAPRGQFGSIVSFSWRLPAASSCHFA